MRGVGWNREKNLNNWIERIERFWWNTSVDCNDDIATFFSVRWNCLKQSACFFLRHFSIHCAYIDNHFTVSSTTPTNRLSLVFLLWWKQKLWVRIYCKYKKKLFDKQCRVGIARIYTNNWLHQIFKWCDFLCVLIHDSPKS